MIIRPRESSVLYGVRFGDSPDISRMPRPLAVATVKTELASGRQAVLMVNAGGQWAEARS